MTRFTKSFTRQEPVPEESIDAAVRVLRTGRLHRYNTAPGETGECALLEQEFADYMAMPYCLACASGGYALHIALRSVGLEAGDPVLTNAFTLSPVPGAIHHAGGVPILVNSGADYTIDLADLRAAAAESAARFFLLSHMRGHIADMEALLEICATEGLIMIEDCAHTMGARWRGKLSGTFGKAACFSTQTYKHLNSGEGGLLVTSDADVIRRAIIYSGSYMLYAKHLAAPTADTFAAIRTATPNYSGRMDNLRAAILRPQLRQLNTQCTRWKQRYRALEMRLRQMPSVTIPQRPEHEDFVGSSIQFSVPALSAQQIRNFIAASTQRGVAIQWFGSDQPHGYTSRHDSWQYLENHRSLQVTTQILSTLCDMRIPLTFTLADCTVIADVIEESLRQVT